MIGFDITDRTRRARGEEIGVAVAARKEQGEQRPKIMLPPKPLDALPVLADKAAFAPWTRVFGCAERASRQLFQ